MTGVMRFKKQMRTSKKKMLKTGLETLARQILKQRLKHRLSRLMQIMTLGVTSEETKRVKTRTMPITKTKIIAKVSVTLGRNKSKNQFRKI